MESKPEAPHLEKVFRPTHQLFSHKISKGFLFHRRYTTKCTTVSPNNESEGELLIGEDSIFFVADEAVTDANYTQVGENFLFEPVRYKTNNLGSNQV